jgi:DNA mismatch endonuclease (patch repair protein)
MDRVSEEKRSWMMSRIKDRDTKPELMVRSLLHSMGYRFRLNRKDLPGKPDIVLPKYKSVIFVHGCFWHQHSECSQGQRQPKSNKDYWNKKLRTTVGRDNKNQILLKELGWKVLVVWECDLNDQDTLFRILSRFLE